MLAEQLQEQRALRTGPRGLRHPLPPIACAGQEGRVCVRLKKLAAYIPSAQAGAPAAEYAALAGGEGRNCGKLYTGVLGARVERGLRAATGS